MGVTFNSLMSVPSHCASDFLVFGKYVNFIIIIFFFIDNLFLYEMSKELFLFLGI